MAYNIAQVVITDTNGNNYDFEMQTYALSDPVTVTSRYGQSIEEGVGDHWNLTGEANYNYGLHQYLKSLADNSNFFTLTLKIRVRLNADDKWVFSQCRVSSNIYIESLDRGAEALISINFSLNKLESRTIVKVDLPV